MIVEAGPEEVVGLQVYVSGFHGDGRSIFIWL